MRTSIRAPFAAWLIACAAPALAQNIAGSIASGTDMACAVTPAGGVKCWGYNDVGQVGDGTIITRTSPVDVTGLTSGVVQVSATFQHACALTTSGTVKCWGSNANGKLGDGTTTNRPAPTDVPGLTGVIAIAVASNHSCALTTAGGMKCWGANFSGELGDGTQTQRLSPVNVTGLTSGVISIAVSRDRSCAVLATGGVKCWGRNDGGYVGDGTYVHPRLTPVNVVGVTDATAVYANSGNVTCVVIASGQAKCWGINADGELGIGSNIDPTPNVPTLVPGLTGVTSMSMANAHTCAVANGAVYCMGRNANGMLGDNTTTDRFSPTLVPTLPAGMAQVALSNAASCARSAVGAVYCWGLNSLGALGDNTTTTRLVPTSVTGFKPSLAAAALGSSHTCALNQSGAVSCFGAGFNGQLGDGSGTGAFTAAVRPTGLTTGVTGITAGANHTCALVAGAVKCWGISDHGQVGDNGAGNRFAPANATGLSSGVTQLDAGSSNSCAVAAGGATNCWGSNGLWNAGVDRNAFPDVFVPKPVTSLVGVAIQKVSVGGFGGCALTTGGGVKCWGGGTYGQIGNLLANDTITATDVTGLGSGIAELASGQYFNCARFAATGRVMCWGRNEYGQLGDGTAVAFRSAAADLSGLTSGVAMMAAGDNFMCALTTAGVVKCWGNNEYGQVGDGTLINRNVPTTVLGLVAGETTAIFAGVNFACALTTSGAMKCWGRNDSGQLGDATTTTRPTPVIAALVGPQAITFNPPATANATLTLSATSTSGKTVTFESLTTAICTVAGTTMTSVSGGLCKVRALQAGTAFVDPAPPITRLIAVRAPQTITFPQIAEITFPSGTVTLSATNSSGLPVSFRSPSTTCAVSGTTLSFSAPGNCVVVAENLGNASFLATETQQTIAVRRVQAMTWPWAANSFRTYSATPLAWSAPTTTGNTPTFTSSRTDVCTFPTQATLQYVTAGLCVVHATHPGDEFTKPLPDTTLLFFVDPAPQSISFPAIASRMLGSGTFTPSATGGPSTNPIVFSSLTTAKCTVASNVVTLISLGTCTLAANLAGDNAHYHNAPQVTQGFEITARPNVASTDFNHDGKPDIVWSNTANGATYLWKMNGLVLDSDVFIALIDTTWKVQGIADFNGDGHPDLVWRNTETGNCYVWYLVDGVLQTDAYLFSLPPEWVIQGVADFNNDARPDFLMRNASSGNAFAWFFNDATAIGDQFLFSIDASWKVEAVGDLDNDGQPDFLFRNMVSGLAFPWNTTWDGTTLALGVSGASMFSIDPAWEIVQLADWNSDGKPDLLFRNRDSGVVFVWYLDGIAMTANSDFIIQIDPSWEIVPKR